MTKQVGMRCYISGKVQGVWFRASAKEQAEQLGITGWAKNLADGRVEVFACGSEGQLNSFYEWLQQGPQHAIVTECVRELLDWQDLSDFSVY